MRGLQSMHLSYDESLEYIFLQGKPQQMVIVQYDQRRDINYGVTTQCWYCHVAACQRDTPDEWL